MKLFKKLAAAVLAAAILPVFPMDSSAADEEFSLKCDIDSSYTINVNDMVLLSRYLLGAGSLTSEQAARADMNDDGSVDTFDLVGMRRTYVRNCTKLPEGTWYSSSADSRRYFYFDENSEGTVITCNTGKLTPFRLGSAGGILTISPSSGAPEETAIAWIDDEHFCLKSKESSPELFSFASDSRCDRGPYLKGDYVENLFGRKVSFESDYTCSMFGNSFSILPLGNMILSIEDDGEVEELDFKRIDKDHFILSNGADSKMHFTRQEIEVKNGITYINGILIVNKTYSLPSSYDPKGLTSEFLKAFGDMYDAAAKDGIKLEICSGYRSYSYQKSLYDRYVSQDGQAAADTYSARAGHSEHQSGLAADINSAETWFAGTPEAKWLDANCYKYGFIIRYPEGKQDITGYIYEPWHIRYLGKENARLVHDSGLTLEEYLGIDSKYS